MPGCVLAPGPRLSGDSARAPRRQGARAPHPALPEGPTLPCLKALPRASAARSRRRGASGLMSCRLKWGGRALRVLPAGGEEEEENLNPSPDPDP